jgi:hypothetical protein
MILGLFKEEWDERSKYNTRCSRVSGGFLESSSF